MVLQQRKTDSVKLILYTSSDAGVHSYHVDSLWSRRYFLPSYALWTLFSMQIGPVHLGGFTCKGVTLFILYLLSILKLFYHMTLLLFSTHQKNRMTFTLHNTWLLTKLSVTMLCLLFKIFQLLQQSHLNQSYGKQNLKLLFISHEIYETH